MTDQSYHYDYSDADRQAEEFWAAEQAKPITCRYCPSADLFDNWFCLDCATNPGGTGRPRHASTNTDEPRRMEEDGLNVYQQQVWDRMVECN